VREAFLTIDAEDDTSFEDKCFATMTLLSTKRFASDLVGPGDSWGEKFIVGPVSCVELPSASGRDGLCVDIIPQTAPDTVFRLINVHLDSLERLSYRSQQLEILAKVLREPGCSGGLIGGDFNSISPWDDELVVKNGLVDAWLALHGSTDPGAPTWSVGRERKDGLKPKRLDKVAMMGLRAEEMEVLHQGYIEVPKPGGHSVLLEWSDHSGLRCVFTI
jgi:tyrosyl-DNA phosphodiesterase 2